MMRTVLFLIVLASALVPVTAAGQARAPHPLASFRGQSVAALVEQVVSPVPEARALVACALAERREAAAPAIPALIALLADTSSCWMWGSLAIMDAVPPPQCASKSKMSTDFAPEASAAWAAIAKPLKVQNPAPLPYLA